MERLTAKELRESLSWLLELSTCPICLCTLQPATVQCVNGHPICMACHQGLQDCPTCRDPFSNVRPTGFIHQVILALPHPCRYQDCTYFVKTNDDHEKFCLAKPTDCKFCEWTGPGRQIHSHIHTTHPKSLFLMEHSQKYWGMPFNPREEGSVFIPMSVHGHFFWGEMKNDPQAEKLTAVIHTILNGKTDSVFFAQVQLKLKNEHYNAGLKLNMGPDVDPYKDNCISIPTTILHKFTDNNELKYKFFVTKDQLASLKNFVRSCKIVELLKK